MKNRDTAFLNEKAEQVASLLKDLSHPLRLKILCHLIEGPKNVTWLYENTQASQVQVSQFLALMKAKGLVTGLRNGNYVEYQLSDKRIQKLIRSLKTIFCT